MWVAEQQGDSSWKAGARTVTTSTGSGISSEIGGNAAGFALAAGVIRPEEIAQGHIDHALQFTSPTVRNTYVKPAIHGDGRSSDANAMPMGTRMQLDPDYDISGLSRVDRIIAQAFKDYGLAVELRHKTWSDDPADTMRLLDSFGAAWAQMSDHLPLVAEFELA